MAQSAAPTASHSPAGSAAKRHEVRVFAGTRRTVDQPRTSCRAFDRTKCFLGRHIVIERFAGGGYHSGCRIPPPAPTAAPRVSRSGRLTSNIRTPENACPPGGAAIKIPLGPIILPPPSVPLVETTRAAPPPCRSTETKPALSCEARASAPAPRRCVAITLRHQRRQDWREDAARLFRCRFFRFSAIWGGSLKRRYRDNPGGSTKKTLGQNFLRNHRRKNPRASQSDAGEGRRQFELGQDIAFFGHLPGGGERDVGVSGPSVPATAQPPDVGRKP